jgi:hypothetical protein
MDQVSLNVFDSHVRTLMSFQQWTEADPAQRADLFRAQLADIKATQSGTRLGDAVSTTADLLSENEPGQKASAEPMARQLVLISDLQQGSYADALQSHQWPANVSLDVRTVAPSDPTNASIQWVKDSPEASDATKLRIRVSNEADSRREQFTLRFASADGPISAVAPVPAYVPPGRSQIMKLDWPAESLGADRLILDGDNCDFDNTLYIVTPRQDLIRVVYLGDDDGNDSKGIRFYLERLISPSASRAMELKVWQNASAATESDFVDARAAVVATIPNAVQLAALKKYLEQGGDVLWVLADPSSAAALSQLSGTPIQASEAPAERFALIARMEYDDPLFAPFSDARYSDFTRIHFWKHRRLSFTDNSGMRTIAWFDNQDPFLVERRIGKGRLLIAASSWSPADSQLALSTKFVPLMDGLLKRDDGTSLDAQYAVGEPVRLSNAAAEKTLIKPDGERVILETDLFDKTDHTGVYQVQAGAHQTRFAVNISGSEGRTTPMAAEDFAQWGVRMGAQPVAEEQIARQRQLQTAEIENRQKIWQWLIVAAMIAIGAETALAGRLTRRAFTTQVST